MPPKRPGSKSGASSSASSGSSSSGSSSSSSSSCIAAQLAVSQKMERADQVIWNEGDLELMREQLNKVLPE